MKLSKTLFLLFLFLFIFPNSVLASSVGEPEQMWNQTYGGVGSEVADTLVETADGGYAMAGGQTSYGVRAPHLYDFWLVKTDRFGVVEWNQSYGGVWERGTWIDFAHSMIQTSDGGYALGGYTYYHGGFPPDCWLVKTDAYGNAQWKKTFGGPEWEKAYSLIQTSDGGYALAGETSDHRTYDGDFFLVKTDADGNLLWNQTYGGRFRQIAYSLIATSDGGYALAGYTWYSESEPRDFWLVKTDANGIMQWHKKYGGAQEEIAYAVVATSDGGYAIAGETESFGAGDYDFWLVKTDSNGNIQWNQTYGGTGYDCAYSLVAMADGGFAIAGETGSFGAGDQDFWLIKTDSNGNMEWNQTYGGTGRDRANSLIKLSDGGYALTGSTDSFGAGGNDFWVVKIGGLVEEIPDSNLSTFPLWILLPLLLVIIVLVVILIRKFKKQKQ